MLCLPVCLEVLAAPVTFPCGHNVCGICADPVVRSAQCPECRAPVLERPMVNTVLRDAVHRAFPALVDARLPEVEDRQTLPPLRVAQRKVAWAFLGMFTAFFAVVIESLPRFMALRAIYAGVSLALTAFLMEAARLRNKRQFLGLARIPSMKVLLLVWNHWRAKEHNKRVYLATLRREGTFLESPLFCCLASWLFGAASAGATIFFMLRETNLVRVKQVVDHCSKEFRESSILNETDYPQVLLLFQIMHALEAEGHDLIQGAIIGVVLSGIVLVVLLFAYLALIFVLIVNCTILSIPVHLCALFVGGVIYGVVSIVLRRAASESVFSRCYLFIVWVGTHVVGLLFYEWLNQVGPVYMSPNVALWVAAVLGTFGVAFAAEVAANL